MGSVIFEQLHYTVRILKVLDIKLSSQIKRNTKFIKNSLTFKDYVFCINFFFYLETTFTNFTYHAIASSGSTVFSTEKLFVGVTYSFSFENFLNLFQFVLHSYH